MASEVTETDQQELVQRHDEAGVVTLTLNRPAQFNALSEAMLASLQAQLDALAQDSRARVVVLAASGKAFCAGHDLKEMRAHTDRAWQQALFTQCSLVMLSMLRLPQPIIGRIHGMATAAGCQLAATCDLAVASTEARFAVSGIKVGLFCSTPSVALARNIARKQAMEMLMTGDFIDAQTACERGLVNRVVAPAALDAAVQDLAARIQAQSAAVVATGKAMFYRQLEMGVSEAYDYTAEVMADNMMQADAGEGIDAFMQKRAPEWRHE